MKISMLADFWNARERRERFLLLTVLAIVVLVLLGAYINKAYSSIAYQSKALDRSKNDFYYVFEKANNALTYQNTQQIIKQTSSVEEFISSQAQSSKISNLKIYEDTSIIFEEKQDDKDLINELLESTEEPLNPYYEKFKSFKFDVENKDNQFKMTLSKYGIIELKNSSLDAAIEIVRRRIDEVGTNEPNILKRGNDRILVDIFYLSYLKNLRRCLLELMYTYMY